MEKLTKHEEEILFPDGISDDWVAALNMPNWKHEVYHKDGEVYGIISMGYDDNDVLMINSGTVKNQPFTVGMRRVILKAALSNDKVVLSSIMKDSAIARFGKYDEKNKCFYKGL